MKRSIRPSRTQHGFVSIGQSPSGSSHLARDRAANASLMLALLASAAMAGGGIYEAFVLFPAWAATLASSFNLLSSAADGAAFPISASVGQFWLGFYGAVGTALLLALVLNWNWGWRRAMVLIALACFGAMRVWSYVSLRPELAEMLGTPASAVATADLIARLSQWGALDRWREAIDCLLVACLALAFRAPSRPALPTGVPAASAYRRQPDRESRRRQRFH